MVHLLVYHPGLSSIRWMCTSTSLLLSLPLIIVYDCNRVKTKVQQRALAGTPYKGPFETLHRLIRGMYTIFMLTSCPKALFRTGSECPQAFSVRYGAHISRTWRERFAKCHYARLAVDPIRHYGDLDRQLTALGLLTRLERTHRHAPKLTTLIQSSVASYATRCCVIAI